MARGFTPKIVTANDLLLGDVIYLDARGNWVRDHASALLLTEEDDAQARLAAAQRDRMAVSVELADAEAGANGPTPVHFREAFRATGPSNYFHGKQAEA